MKEEWLFPNAIVPVDVETTAALVAEIHRLIGVVGGMALAQPEQEPVCDKDPQGCWNVRCQLGKKCKNTPPQRTWVGLTEDERDHLTGLHLYAVRGQVEAWIEGVDDFAQAYEDKLKEKNT